MLADLEELERHSNCKEEEREEGASSQKTIKRTASQKKGAKRAMLDWTQNLLSKRLLYR